MRDIVEMAGDQIVDRDDAVAFGYVVIGQMPTEKASATGDDRDGLRLFPSHCALYLMADARVGQRELARSSCSQHKKVNNFLSNPKINSATIADRRYRN